MIETILAFGLAHLLIRIEIALDRWLSGSGV